MSMKIRITRPVKRAGSVSGGREPPADQGAHFKDVPVVTDKMFRQDISPSSKGFDVLAQELARRLPAWMEEESSPSARAGVFLRTMRNAAGLSQVKVGQLAQMQQSDISSLENGQGIHGPSFDVIARIADACGFYLTFESKASARVPAAVSKARAQSHDVQYSGRDLAHALMGHVVRTYVMSNDGQLQEFEGTSPALGRDATIIVDDPGGRTLELSVKAPKAQANTTIVIEEAKPSIAAALQHARAME
jgi:transcriptional regulator with XRE-family HTH domain